MSKRSHIQVGTPETTAAPQLRELADRLAGRDRYIAKLESRIDRAAAVLRIFTDGPANYAREILQGIHDTEEL